MDLQGFLCRLELYSERITSQFYKIPLEGIYTQGFGLGWAALLSHKEREWITINFSGHNEWGPVENLHFVAPAMGTPLQPTTKSE